MINTRFGGAGSTWAKQALSVHTVGLRGPVGDLLLRPDQRPKLFIATGTRIDPILPILAALAAHGRVTDALEKLPVNWTDCDGYVTGNPDLVKDVQTALIQLRTKTIYAERY